MTLNSIRTLVVAGSLLSIVACGGKNKNDLKIDGTYELQPETVATDKAEQQVSLVDIKDNVMTSYTFSMDKKAVEIAAYKLDVKGKKLVGMTTLNDNLCTEEASGVKVLGSGALKKTSSNLVLSSNETTVVLKAIPQEQFDALTKDLKEGKVQKACIVDGKVTKKLGSLTEEDTKALNKDTSDKTDDESGKVLDESDESLAQVSEKKSAVPQIEDKENKADDKSASDASSSSQDDEQSLKSQSNGSGESEQSDLVSEQKG